MRDSLRFTSSSRHVQSKNVSFIVCDWQLNQFLQSSFTSLTQSYKLIKSRYARRLEDEEKILRDTSTTLSPTVWFIISIHQLWIDYQTYFRLWYLRLLHSLSTFNASFFSRQSGLLYNIVYVLFSTHREDYFFIGQNHWVVFFGNEYAQREVISELLMSFSFI